VLEPSKEVLEELMRLAPLLPSYDKTDQGFLNEMWMGSWHMLPYTYNFLKGVSCINVYRERERESVCV